jgi:pimeloyl-ACP methyl ester carboxylesterase
METEIQIVLRDGRRLGYAEYGDPGGAPVLYFHGFPGSRLEARPAHSIALAMNVRLVAIDRPGYGLSDDLPGRTLLDWPGDVVELADQLALERFSIIGVSGGGPYAAVTAARIPQRLRAVAIACGLAPLVDPQSGSGLPKLRGAPGFFARRSPRLACMLLATAAPFIRRHPEGLLFHFRERSTPADRDVLARPEVWKSFCDSLSEAFRSGSKGAVRDLQLYSRYWGFRLQEIRSEVQLWQGELDTIIPAEMGRYYEREIPDCRASYHSDEGHLSLVFNHIDEMLSRVPNEKGDIPIQSSIH